MENSAITQSFLSILACFTLTSLATERLLLIDHRFGIVVLFLQAGVGSARNLIQYLRENTSRSINRRLVLFYILLATLDTTVRVLVNSAYQEGASVPLTLLFRSSSPIWVVCLGALIFRHKYQWTRFIHVVIISLGLTLVSGVEALETSGSVSFQGIIYLHVATMLGALIGHLQHVGQDWHPHSYSEEQLAVQLLTLPMLLLLPRFAPGVKQQRDISELPCSINIIGYLLLATGAYVLGMDAIYSLLRLSDVLTVTLAVTLRKFVSIAASALLFGSPFKLLQWLGSAICLIGTLLYIRSNNREHNKPS